MILALAASFVVVFVVQALVYRDTLAREAARVNDLLLLLEAKAAPAETAAYITSSQDEDDAGTWLSSPDGLITVRVDD